MTCPTQKLEFDVSPLTSDAISRLVSMYRALLTENSGEPDGSVEGEGIAGASDLTPAPISVRPTAESIASAVSTGWTPQAYAALLDQLRANDRRDYAELLEAAMEVGGSLDRDSVYGTMGWLDNRQMKGFTRPFRTAINILVSRGELPEGARIPLETEYDETIKGYQKSIGVVVAAEILQVMGIDPV